MIAVRQRIDIRNWDKKKILDKISEIFNTYDKISWLRVDFWYLEYEVWVYEPEMKNPSVRIKNERSNHTHWRKRAKA